METTQTHPDLNNPKDFRLLLQTELVLRCKRNPTYSLRAFAKLLEVSSSALSAMLSGKRKITPPMIERFGNALCLSPEIINRHKVMAREARTLSPSKEDKFQQIAMDMYAVIADWYHYAILELIKVRSFQPDLNWVARSLGITKSEANIAVERLVRVGLLEINPKGRWIDRSSDGNATNISGKLTSAASRLLQKQILELSLKALEEVPIERRSHTSLTMAINIEDLSIAQEKIKKFRRELAETLEGNPQPSHVYHLNVSLYPVTKT